jgi:hypothetical protein
MYKVFEVISMTVIIAAVVTVFLLLIGVTPPMGHLMGRVGFMGV